MTLYLWGLLRTTCQWSQTLDPLVFLPEEGQSERSLKGPSALPVSQMA